MSSPAAKSSHSFRAPHGAAFGYPALQALSARERKAVLVMLSRNTGAVPLRKSRAMPGAGIRITAESAENAACIDAGR